MYILYIYIYREILTHTINEVKMLSITYVNMTYSSTSISVSLKTIQLIIKIASGPQYALPLGHCHAYLSSSYVR